MKKLTLMGLFALLGGLPAFAVDEEPIITFKTNIYEQTGSANSFTIRLGSTQTAWFDYDCGATSGEVEVEPATFDTDASEIKATSISCNVDKEGIVKIYGDASLIDYFDGEGAYIEWIDFGNCTNLEIIDLQHNQLQRLDLSKYTKLSAIYLTDNPFTPETPLVIGENHPDLIILEVDIIDYMDPDFDITTYPNLISFDAYHNLSLTHLDPSKCPNLQRLAVDLCPIRSLDVSKNVNLRVLNIEDSGICDIDISKNVNLTQFYAGHAGVLNHDRKFTSIDLSNNPLLTFVSLTGNQLKSIDLSKNPNIDNLYLGNNLLSSIDVSAQTKLSNLNISKNYFTFATLPAPQSTWYDYVYEQYPMSVNRSYPIDAVIDLSDKVLRAGTTTDCELYAYDVTSNTSRLLDDSYYEYADGKVTVKKVSSDSLYLSFANSAFVGVPITTTRFMVKTADEYGKPSETVSFGTVVGTGSTISLSIGMQGASTASPKTLYVNPGDGSMLTFTITESALPDKPNVSFSRAQSGNLQLLVPENEVLTALGIDNLYLTLINVKAAPALEYLSLTGTELYKIDLGYNKALKSLTLTGNHFSSGLSLEGVNGISAKNMLADINLGNNELSEIVLNDARAIVNLDLSNNKIATFTYEDFDNIKSFNLSHNLLTSVNTTYMGNAESVDVSHNNLTEIILPAEGGMASLDISHNAFTFANLPQVSSQTKTYIYAPQAEIVMPAKAPGANLSAQNINIDGNSTVYVWKTKSGEVLTEGTDYRITNGATSFLAPAVGKLVYCQMTNAAYPQFAGDNALSTTLMEAAEMPTNLIASFTTPTGGQAVSLSLASDIEGTAVYIDWSGNGSSVEQYVLGSTYRQFSATTIAGATAKVYTYNTNEHLTVFSIAGATLSDFDGSKLSDAYGIMLHGARLSSVTLPDVKTNLQELSLDGNTLSSLGNIGEYTNLKVLDLSGNAFETVDVSVLPQIEQLYLGNNGLTDIKFGGNNRLWILYAAGNKLSQIDFNGAKAIQQLDLGHNEFETIDVSPLSNLKVLSLVVNKFTFATLPAAINMSGESIYSVYNYGSQAPLAVECIDGKVNLSSQASVGSNATVYRWFVGVPEIDSEGNMNGEELILGDEYTISDGVTTFNISYDGLMCVMTNAAFPNLYLYTNLINVTSGIENVIVDNDMAKEYYTIEGIRVNQPRTGKIYIVRQGDKVKKMRF